MLLETAVAAALLLGAAGAAGAAPVAPPARPPNVLYLMADDMRPQLGCYGQKVMKTPHIDGLAASGLLFETAYTQFAYCAPSRNSFLSGRRPERTRALNFRTDFRKQHGDAWVSMPQFFKNAGSVARRRGTLVFRLRPLCFAAHTPRRRPSHPSRLVCCDDSGYFTSAAGKLFHDGMDDPLSWSFPSNQTWWTQCKCGALGGDRCDVHGNYCEVTANSSVPYTDEEIILHEGP